MSNKSLIKVESSHIQQAIPRDSGRCMIADAIKDARQGCTRVSVDLQTIRFTDSGDVRRTYLTPGPAQAALARFDDGLPVEPFGFHLSNPIHVSPPGDIQRKKGPGSRPGRHVATSPKGDKVVVHGGPTPRKTRRGTRRVFGMRGLRVNERGEVQQ